MSELRLLIWRTSTNILFIFIKNGSRKKKNKQNPALKAGFCLDFADHICNDFQFIESFIAVVFRIMFFNIQSKYGSLII